MAFCIRTKIGFSLFFRASFANYCSKKYKHDKATENTKECTTNTHHPH